MIWPLVPFKDYVVSGPVLPDFYWDVYSQEQRIKEICKRLKAMIEYLELMMEALNDLNSRVSYFEDELALIRNQINELINMMEGWESRISNLEDSISTLTNLLNQLSDIVTDNYEELLGMITELEDRVSALESALENINISVEGAVENNIAVFNDEGKLKDSGYKVIYDESGLDGYGKQVAVFDYNGNVVSSEGRVSDGPFWDWDYWDGDSFQDIMTRQSLLSAMTVDVDGDDPTMSYNNYSSFGIIFPLEAMKKWDGSMYGTNTYFTIMHGGYTWRASYIHQYLVTNQDYPNGIKDSVIQCGWFFNQETDEVKYFYRNTFGDKRGQWYPETSNEWRTLTNDYLRELTPEAAKATSLLYPDALVYVPEEEEV